MDIGLEDLMLGRIAAECVMSAVTLVETLNASIKLHDFMAWWINVSCRLCECSTEWLELTWSSNTVLHTSGSTILMGRLCTFNDANFTQDSLLETWNMCLRNLGRYDGLSSIAKKSCYILNQSAKRLIPGHGMHSPGNGELNIQQEENQFWQQDRGRGVRQSTDQGSRTSVPNDPHNHNGPIVETLTGHIGNENSSLESVAPLEEQLPFLEPDLRFDHIPDIDNEFSGGDIGTLNWQYFPCLSQLETMSPRFDF